VLQVGFAFIAAIAVFVAVIASRWESTESQLQTAVTSAARTAVAESYANESSAGVQLNNQFSQTLETAAMSELGDTSQEATDCQPIPGVTSTCNGANGAIWFGIPVSSSMAENGVVDLGEAETGSDTVTIAMVLDPPPVLGIQVPLGASQVVNINLGSGASNVTRS
jgi:hypothetical protein